MYQKLRKNLGAKNYEFAPEQIEKITHLYLEMQPAAGAEGKGISKIFDNRDFGYYKVTVDRPLRLAAQFTAEILQLEQETEGLLKKLVSFGEMG